MKTRVLELCKQRGLSLREVAEKIGMKQSNLSSSLNNNPTLSTLQAVASCLMVPVTELFAKEPTEISGYLERDGKVSKIGCYDDIVRSVGCFGIKPYYSFKQMKKDIKAFIKTCQENQHSKQFSAIIDNHLVLIVAKNDKEEVVEEDLTLEFQDYTLNVYAEGKEPFTVSISECEFLELDNSINLAEVLEHLWVELVGGIYPDLEIDEKEMNQFDFNPANY